MKKSLVAAVFVLAFALAARQASAHAIVSPDQATVSQLVNFSLAVPSEKPTSTVAVKLLLPPGLNEVTPFAKAGWTVKVKQQPEVANGKPVMTDDGTQAQAVSEIDWTGGSIPADEQDQFLFTAQVPDTAVTLDWKVYQTYEDGSVVSWDQSPGAPQPTDSSGNPDFSKVGPYSSTQVINVAGANAAASHPNGTEADWALGLSIIAVVLAAWAVIRKPVAGT